MITFSPVIILAPFFVYLFIHLALGLINIKHLIKVGALTFTSFVFTSVFVVYSLVVVGITWNLIGDYNWKQPIEIDFGNILNTSNQF